MIYGTVEMACLQSRNINLLCVPDRGYKTLDVVVDLQVVINIT
jgi:hypothetical protein